MPNDLSDLAALTESPIPHKTILTHKAREMHDIGDPNVHFASHLIRCYGDKAALARTFGELRATVERIAESITSSSGDPRENPKREAP